MNFLYINNVLRSDDLQNNTLKKQNEIQQRADTLSFTIFQGAAPAENQDVKYYVGDTIASAVGDTLVLSGNFERQTNKFFENQILFLRIGENDEEKVVVDSFDEDTLTLVLTETPDATISPGDKIGDLRFGGIASRVKDRNVGYLDNLEWDVECVDYSKIFDRKLINDTWAGVDARYIINDFLNTTVNYSRTLDSMSYADDAAIQAEWIEGGAGDDPTVDTTNYIEGTSSGVFNFGNISTGVATYDGTPISADFQNYVGAASGMPAYGDMMLWMMPDNPGSISDVKVRIGSDSSNYLEITFDPPASVADWEYQSRKLINGTLVGTPNWTAIDYIQIRITCSQLGFLRLNGLRINGRGSFTMYNVQSTPIFVDFRAPQQKPTSLMQLLSKNFEYIWYINYEKDIVFRSATSVLTPFDIYTISNNFNDLSIEIDQSQLGNRIVIRGGEKTSTSYYAQVEPGDNARREWLMKSKFADLSILIDNNSATDTMEATTTTTTVKATAHGLLVGDHIVNRTRNNAVREVLTVPDADTFTVQAVTSQVSGDTFSKFSVAASVGVEGLTDEGTVDYVGNTNEKSVRAVPNTATLNATTFIRFKYKERIPIQFVYTDSASANALKALGFGDGIFDLDPITDRNIQDTNTAVVLAQAKVNDFRNPLITGTFKTDQDGLLAGQVITIQDMFRDITADYVIQKVTSDQQEGENSDYFIHSVTFGTSLFGVVEFYQKLLKTKDALEIGIDDIVETFVSSSEIVECVESSQAAVGGVNQASEAEIVECSDVNATTDYSGAWHYEVSVGQPLPTRFNLSAYS